MYLPHDEHKRVLIAVLIVTALAAICEFVAWCWRLIAGK
jgi:hypothetical protein